MDMENETYYVYVISSELVRKFYIGMSVDPEARLMQHNAGQSKFTKSFRPWTLIYSEFAGDREKARKLEKYYKSGAGRSRLKEMKLIPDEKPESI